MRYPDLGIAPRHRHKTGLIWPSYWPSRAKVLPAELGLSDVLPALPKGITPLSIISTFRHSADDVIDAICLLSVALPDSKALRNELSFVVNPSEQDF